MPHPVQCHEEKLILPYYRPGEADLLPPLLPEAAPRGKRVYPYALRELTGKTCEQTEFTALILENDFLKLTVLPALGGRLIGLYDKREKTELLFRNPVLKPVMAGLTGAWCGIGMEFNFPGSHSVSSDLPVCCQQEIRADGSGSITISDRELVSGMRWSVKLTLRPDSDAVYQESEYCNRTDMPHPAYWWTNAKVPAYDDTEFIFPARCASGAIHPPMDTTRIAELDLPYVNRVDIRHYKSVYFQLPLFFRELRSGSFGVYHRKHGVGLLHHAGCGTLAGRKIWTLGTGDDGQVINENLTLDGAPNIELQAGPLPLQTDFFLLRPGEASLRRETWLPVRNMAARHLASSEAFTVSAGDSVLRIQCHSALPPVQLKIKGHSAAGFVPETGKIYDFPLPEDGETFELTDPAGFRLLSNSVTPPKEKGDKNIVTVTSGAESDCIRARYREEIGRPEEAVPFYRKALESDGDNTAALKGLAVHALAANRPEEALGFLRKALARNRRDPESAYYCGMAEQSLGDFENAVCHLEQARSDAAWNSAAAACLGRFYLRMRRGPELESLLSESPESEEMLELSIVFRRLTGKDNRGEIARLRRLAPENPLAEFESGRCPKIPDVRKILLTAGWYFDLGLEEDARKLASPFASEDPILAYLSGKPELAEAKPAGGIFPPPMLQKCLETLAGRYPDAPRLHYYLGTLRAANNNWDSAADAWEKAKTLGCGDPELFRNLGIYYWKKRHMQKRAAEYYAAGLQKKGVGYKYICEYDALLMELGDLASRRKLLENLPVRLQENPYIIVRRAALAGAGGRWRDTLALLEKRHFVLCEGKRMTCDLFIKANCALGEAERKAERFEAALHFFRSALSYPHSLGAGRSIGKFDMKTKFRILETLSAANRKAEAETLRTEYLEECERFAIDFQPLSNIRWECGTPCADPLLDENQTYFDKIRRRDYE